jgi:hypothetical protein
MKKSVQLTVLAILLGLAAVFGTSRQASAGGGFCWDIDGTPCFSEGATRSCQPGGAPFSGICSCWGGSWVCN